jgi:hypothetical protein
VERTQPISTLRNGSTPPFEFLELIDVRLSARCD